MQEKFMKEALKEAKKHTKIRSASRMCNSKRWKNNCKKHII